MDSKFDFVDLNVPGLMSRYSNPTDEWQDIVRALATTQLSVFRCHGLINESAPALAGPIEHAVVRFSDYTALGQAFVKTGALDKWLASCDRKRTLAAYRDAKPLERRVLKFKEAQQSVGPLPTHIGGFMFNIKPIGHVRSPLALREHAPKQGNEGAPEAWLVFQEEFLPGLSNLRRGDELLVLTWLHEANRQTLQVHPRDDAGTPLTGVFSTRSQDRPNPIGIHRGRVLDIVGPTKFRVADLEAFDATPIIDVKPVLDRVMER